MSIIDAVLLSVLLLSLSSFPFVLSKRKAWGSKSLKKLSKSEVQVKTILLPCSYEKEVLNSTHGSNRNHLLNCKRKFVIKLSVNSGGEYCSKSDGFIPIDHVTDGITGRKKRLLNPFMVRLKREKMYQLYDLQLVKTVNAEAKEEVINHENTPNYTGCDTSSSHPTCGFSFFNNKIIQFSEGFCCSCDQNKNDQRQPCEGSSHENKDFQDMEYAAHPPRSNRTSRDLETAKLNIDMYAPDSRKQLINNLDVALSKLSSESAKPLMEYEKVGENLVSNNLNSHIDHKNSQNQINAFNGQKEPPTDACKDFKPALNDHFGANNVTVKRFEFEHSLDNNIEHPHSISPLNIVVDAGGKDNGKQGVQGNQPEMNDTNSPGNEILLSKTVKLEDSAFDYLSGIGGDLNEYFDAFKHSEIQNNPIDREKFKQLVIKRIKDNKNKEEMLNDQHPGPKSPGANETIINPASIKNSRDLKISPNCSTIEKFDFGKKRGISLKIENDNSELRLQIITKKPKITKKNNKEASNGLPGLKPKTFFSCRNSPSKNKSTKDELQTFCPEQTTKKGIKQRIIKYFQSIKNQNNTSRPSDNPKNSSISCQKYMSITPPVTVNNRETGKNNALSSTKCTTPSLCNQTKIFFLPPTNVTKLNSIVSNSCKTVTNTSDIEGLMYKLIPAINTAHDIKSIDTGNCKKADGIVADLDNSTYSIYIELKKQTDETEDKMNKKNSSAKQSPAVLKDGGNGVKPKYDLITDKTEDELNKKRSSVKQSPAVLKDGGNGVKPKYDLITDKTEDELNKQRTSAKQSPASLKDGGNGVKLKYDLLPNDHIETGGYSYKGNNNEDQPLEMSRTKSSSKSLLSHNLSQNQLHNNIVQSVQKREATCDTQIRGGQSCSKKGELSCNANPETYFESAHCLRFSDLWYNVFKLSNPRLENSVTVKMYAKHKTPDKRICWENLTKRLPGRVGTINEVLTDDSKNIMITYSSDDKVSYNLDCNNNYILVPQPLPRSCKDSELNIVSYGGPEEYLVLKQQEITFDGEECDKAGVNYAAFARQLHRCQKEAGSCLKNQPLQYWRKDKELAKAGKGGHYFLKNFIEVTDQAILQNTTNNQVVLRAPYVEKYQSQIVIEMNADHVEIIGDKTEGQITEVYTDATSEKKTVVRVVVTNLGIASDFFGVDFANCSSRLGPSDFDKPGKDEIPPQHRITYTATISSPLKSRRVECRMLLYNQDSQVIASRNIVIVQGHRCMCVWHCQCACYNHPNPGLPCNPLSVADYNRAGFVGHLPVTTGSDCSTLFTVLHALLWFFLFLILFGLIKAILGLCSSTIGLWGLWYLLPDEAKSLQMYLEPQNACCPVVRDCDGFPIHPHTYRRTDVHFLPWYTEFIVNVFFFICVFRSCLCDHSFRSASGMYYQDYSKPRGRDRCCSPNCSVRYRSPCGSVCSNRRNRKFRVSAGAEEEFLNPDPQLLKDPYIHRKWEEEAMAVSQKDDEWAKRLVDELTRSYIVFRVLTRPIGGVKSVPGTPYCVRGFFLESENGVYEFTPPSPLMQIWQMDGSPLDPPLRLDPGPFHALYRSAREVLGAHELSPWAQGVVINAP